MGTCIRQGDLFYSAGLHRNHVLATASTGEIWRGFGKNAGEWTGRWDFHFCVRSSPLRGHKLTRTKQRQRIPLCRRHTYYKGHNNRHESPTVTVTWHTSLYKVHKLHQRHVLTGKRTLGRGGFEPESRHSANQPVERLTARPKRLAFVQTS